MTQKYLIRDVLAPLEAAKEPRAFLLPQVAKILNIPSSEILNLQVSRRALDSRRVPVRFNFAVEIEVSENTAMKLTGVKGVEKAPTRKKGEWVLKTRPDGPPPLVVGAGPAGLFAALTLAQAGWAPIILERGKNVRERGRDISALYSRGVLDPESNVCFGEGGAGTYSDGKLHTRVHDERVLWVLETLVAKGADPDILISNRPHLGTDRLVVLLENIRLHLEKLGARFLFQSRAEKFLLKNGAIHQVVLADQTPFDVSAVILATGHSAREVWFELEKVGLPLEARPFAMGFRVEHPQVLIDQLRYRKLAGSPGLPAADYRVAYNEPNGRGVFSFCMCPGGVVVPTPTEPEELCINGMSHSTRSGRFANSALVVSVTPKDLEENGFSGLFAGVKAQKAVERAAFEKGGGDFAAPACRLSDFMRKKMSSTLGETSYRRGLLPADLSSLYPAFVSESLRRAIHRFDSTMHGFNTNEATLIGVETRTASPIRLVRGEDLQVPGCAGLYPAGEGMGYGGGIVSSAVDGVRCAEALLTSRGATWLLNS